ncbi:MAG: hypothetical protein AABX52_04485, partial [Nanoarchaeota archaeon]
MEDLAVGLGLWHEDVQRIIDGFMYGRNPNLREHKIERLDEIYWPRALELQVGSLDLFTARQRKRVQFGYNDFSPDASVQFFEELVSNLNEKKFVSFEDLQNLTTQGAIHKTFDWIRAKQYRGVHSSDSVYDKRFERVIPCDLTHPDDSIQQLAIWKYKSLMNLADVINATSFVMHPIPIIETPKGWFGMPYRLSDRRERKNRFYESMSTLFSYYRDQGFIFPMLIENLEFPKFPATLEECVEMLG